MHAHARRREAVVGWRQLRHALVALAFATAGASTARADDEDPQFDTPKAKAGEVWMTAMLAPGGSVAAPSKDKPLDYVVANATRSCKAMKAGTAKDMKALMKLKTCVVDSYKAAASDRTITGQWMEYGAAAVPGIVSSFPARQAKKMKAQAKGSTVVQGHYSGDGLNFDVFLVQDADGHVKALWVSEEAFE